MRLVARLVWVLALWVFPVGGCNEVTTPTTAPLTLVVSGTSAPDDPGVLLEGVWLCELDNATNCALSDPTGRVTIQLPFGETAATLTKEGYASFLLPYVNGASGPPDDSGVFKIEGNQFVADQFDRVMSDYPMRSTGTIILAILPAQFAGATFDLLGATGKAFYYDEEGWWSLGFKATTSWGWGGFTDVSAGAFQAEVGGTAQRCTPFWGWPGDVENTVRFPVREGYLTWVRWSCPPPLPP